MRKRTAFSKCEACILVLCLGFVLALCFPVLGRGRHHAQAMVCMSHLYQWGHIMGDFTTENNGSYPPEFIGYPAARGSWMEVLHPWWQESEVLLKCPSATEPGEIHHGGPNTAHATWGFPNVQDVRGSYGINLWVLNENRTIQGRNPANHWGHVNSLTEPANIPVFLDAMWRGGGPTWEHDYAIARPAYNGQWLDYNNEMMHFAIDRHAGGVNSLFADDSVRQVSVKELWRLKWHRYYDTGQVDRKAKRWWGPWLGATTETGALPSR